MAEMHRRRKLDLLALVALGGFGGAVLRYLVGDLVPGLGGTLLAVLVAVGLAWVLVEPGSFG